MKEKRDFKGVWIPSELIARYGIKIAGLSSAFFIGGNLITESDLKFLKSKKVIVSRNIDSQSAKNMLCKKKPQGNIGNLQCEWCGCNTLILESHHFPIPKRMEGKETVNICANCHKEYHFLVDFNYQLIPEIINILEKGK